MPRRKQSITYQVFLSHSSRDLWISERMKEKMEMVGASVWLDAFDLPGGTNVKERIREGLRSSAECLILLSPASRDSDWVRHEAGIADGCDLPTTLVLLHVPKEGIPDPLREQKSFDINEFGLYVQHLSSVIRTQK